MPFFKNFFRLSLAVLLALLVVGLRNASEADTASERFSATAVQLDAPMGNVTTPVDILIDRWSTDEERDTLVNHILESTPARLLSAVQKLPRVGSIRAAAGLGWDLRFARRTMAANGTERITIVTDRPVAFWETQSGSRTLDYPYTVIEFRISPNGQGEGQMTVGTRISADKEDRTIVLENYGIQPVMLTNVKREK